jgi:hypothetical protein
MRTFTNLELDTGVDEVPVVAAVPITKPMSISGRSDASVSMSMH